MIAVSQGDPFSLRGFFPTCFDVLILQHFLALLAVFRPISHCLAV